VLCSQRSYLEALFINSNNLLEVSVGAQGGEDSSQLLRSAHNSVRKRESNFAALLLGVLNNKLMVRTNSAPLFKQMRQGTHSMV
jgi:hypothetical protein